MTRPTITTTLLLLIAVCSILPVQIAQAQKRWPSIFPEQRTIRTRLPSDFAPARIPDNVEPPTVSNKKEMVERPMSLDDAIRIALANAKVVRFLGGVSASSSGRTIYDTAISNTAIDEANARFDPNFNVNNTWSQTDPPSPRFDLANPGQTIFGGVTTENHNMSLGLSKQNVAGGSANFNVNTNHSRFKPGVFPLNPENRSAVELSYTQPLLRGAGFNVNMVPIVVARIDTERSYFQFKDGTQELVRGVISGYWSLVFSRANVWARRIQVEQLEFALEFAEKSQKAGRVDIGTVAQTRASYANFRANLVAAESDVLQREGALRNVLGLPPYDGSQIIPTSTPTNLRLEPVWEQLLMLGEQNRPDIIELKLVLEADEQRILQANNTARPQLDAVALYRWNGIEGRMPNAGRAASGLGQYADWTLGINFSVPIGLRQSRAGLRRQELVLARDRANVQQGLHAMVHTLALELRVLDQAYDQYEAFQEARKAARLSLDYQRSRYREGFGQPGQSPLLSFLLAVTDWGNSVSAEASALTQYNTELATLERQTGTILESHGVRLYEERFGSIGPLGRFADAVCYPEAIRPSENIERYPQGEEPAENYFDLEDPTANTKKKKPATSPPEDVPKPNLRRPIVPPPTIPPPN